MRVLKVSDLKIGMSVWDSLGNEWVVNVIDWIHQDKIHISPLGEIFGKWELMSNLFIKEPL